MTRGMKGRAATAVAALIGLLGVLLTAGATVPADAAKASSVAYGTIGFPHHDNPKIQVLWFTKDWGYLGRANAAGGSYSINLDPGTYRLQFVDQRPSYLTSKYAPTDIKVTVDADGTRKNVTMTRGAFITGTVKAHGKRAGQAKVVAANTSEQSFTTTANKKGQFAVGGLPAGGYSVFSYDHRHTWVDKSTWAGGLGPGQSSNVAINLRKKAGSLRVYLFTKADGQKKRVSGRPVVTAVSKVTGQFWSVKSKGGSAVFQGLYPGRYKLVANGFGNWFGKTAAVQGDAVKAGRAGFGSFTYTKRGGWVTGQVVDGSDSSFPIAQAEVALYNGDGALLAAGTADADGYFKLGGQLTTTPDLTITIAPPKNTGGWTNSSGGLYCHFENGSFAPVSVKVGRGTALGPLPLPHSTQEQESSQPTQCVPEGG